MNIDKKNNIGEGSQGKIFSISPNVVCKKYTDEGLCCSVIREISALKTLHGNSNIPKCLGIYFEPNPMIHLPRFTSDLEYFLKKNHQILNHREKKMIIYQIASGLFHAHRLRISHRDLKIQNILINENTLEVAICDWGSSRFMDTIFKADYTYSPQTYIFSSPECLIKNGIYNISIDMWSLGIIICYLINGGYFKEMFTTNKKKILKWITETFNDMDKTQNVSKIIKTTDKALKNLIEKLLTVDPENRMTVQECLNHYYFNGIRTEWCTVHSPIEVFHEWFTDKHIKIFIPREKQENRTFVVKKIIALSDKCRITTTIFTAIMMLDMCLTKNFKQGDENKIAMACLLLSSKAHEIDDFDHDELCEHFIETNLLIMKNLNRMCSNFLIATFIFQRKLVYWIV
jgi:serine/threonine protein kinase